MRPTIVRAPGTQTGEPLLTRGWRTLVRGLGQTEATRFLRTISIGKGDSVKEFHALWNGMTLQQMDVELKRFKKRPR